jgi:two-component system chemotaxis sensor kinase CheA
MGIARRAALLRDHDEAASDVHCDAETQAPVQETCKRNLLVVGLGGDRQAAIPLSSVARLEEFQASAVENAANSDTVQYRGEIMPLVHIRRLIDGVEVGERSAGKLLRVVVYTHEGRRYGLVVDTIVDTVETDVQEQRCTNRSGILGSLVLHKRVTDLLDIPDLINRSGVVAFETEETMA